jgi:plastocyanin
MRRRDVLKSLAAAGFAVLGGCGESSTEGDGEPTSQTDPSTDTATASPTEPPTATRTPTATATPRRGTVKVDVGPGTFFRPASVVVAPGTTIRWVWQSDNHNIAVREQPESAEWDGHTRIEGTGFEYEYEFTVVGSYQYFCEPHVRQGMAGEVTVR